MDFVLTNIYVYIYIYLKYKVYLIFYLFYSDWTRLLVTFFQIIPEVTLKKESNRK